MEKMEENMEGQEVREEKQHGRDRPGRRRSAAGIRRADTGRKSRNGRRAFPWPPVVCVLAVILTAGFFFMREGKGTEPRESLVYEANIVSGDIPGKTKEERQRELDAIVEEGMLAMSINATPTGRTTGADRNINWLIENPSNQGKLIRVEIWRDDTGEKVYETGAIPPGNYVESAPLAAELKPGQYSCTARFYAYQEEDEQYIGQAAAQIRLTLYE